MRQVVGSGSGRTRPKAWVQPVSTLRSTHPAADALAVGAVLAATLLLVCARLLSV